MTSDVLYDTTVEKVFELAQLLTGSPAAAEALVQRTYRDGWGRIEELPSSGRSPQAWLLSITYALGHAHCPPEPPERR